jgi:type I restriction enzyme S subunit
MREGWKKMSILDVCKVYQPQTIATSKLIEGAQYDVFGANGCIGKYNQYNHEEDEVLLTCRGATCGNINRSTPKSWINGNAMVVHPIGSGLIKDFLMYALKSVDFSKVITGAAQPQITRTSLSSVTLSIPPLSEQERIVSLLDLEFAKIDAIKANAEKQLQDAKDLFQSVLKNLLTPKEGWKKGCIGDIADIRGGKRVPKGYKFESEPTKHIYIRVSNFNNLGSIDTSELMYISDEVYEQIKRYIITDEDVYISIAGTIGKAGIIPSELNGANLTENACRLVLNGKVYKRFVYYYTLLNSFKERLKQLTKTGSQPKLAITRLATAEITYPDIEEQKEIVKLLDLIIIKLDKLQSNYEQTITLCNDLKQSILKDIFG